MTTYYPHVNVVDDRLGNSWHEYARRERHGGQTYYIRVNSAWSMDRIARRVLQYSNNIGILRLCSHGNSDYIQLGQGLTAGNAWRFRLLRNHFVGQYPRVEVHACGVLSSTSVAVGTPGTVSTSGAGHVIMQAVADAVGVLAIGAYHVQWSDSAFAYEHLVRHFRPTVYYRSSA